MLLNQQLCDGLGDGPRSPYLAGFTETLVDFCEVILCNSFLTFSTSLFAICPFGILAGEYAWLLKKFQQ